MIIRKTTKFSVIDINVDDDNDNDKINESYYKELCDSVDINYDNGY